MIIVTGASRGLGAAICERLQSQNKEIFGLARDTSSLSFHAMDCDVSSYDNIKSVAQKLKKEKIRDTHELVDLLRQKIRDTHQLEDLLQVF